MKKLSIFSAAVLSLAVSAFSQAQQASGTGEVSAQVQFEDVTVSQLVPLDFGVVLPFGRSGSLTVSPTGPQTASNLLSTVSATPAEWRATGVPGAPFAISFPSSIDLTTGDGLNSMRVDSFRTNFRNPINGAEQGAFPASGETTLLVGARLVVNANQAAGIYSGQYQITVAYN
ncbi:DUF4402 domain-containing protein [Sessilibacter corallicola]|uniref:DUF4402 domain-containing protein n=1 Tax=Sessilibacter corallicola TaxID=2904075 RepID=A0ABQ0A4S9_9GAMM